MKAQHEWVILHAKAESKFWVWSPRGYKLFYQKESGKYESRKYMLGLLIPIISFDGFA